MVKFYSKRLPLYSQSNNTKNSLNFGLTFTKAPGFEELLMKIWLSNCCKMFFGVTRHPIVQLQHGSFTHSSIVGPWAGSILNCCEYAAISNADQVHPCDMWI